jgi:hypothetical protein
VWREGEQKRVCLVRYMGARPGVKGRSGGLGRCDWRCSCMRGPHGCCQMPFGRREHSCAGCSGFPFLGSNPTRQVTPPRLPGGLLPHPTPDAVYAKVSVKVSSSRYLWCPTAEAVPRSLPKYQDKLGIQQPKRYICESICGGIEVSSASSS